MFSELTFCLGQSFQDFLDHQASLIAQRDPTNWTGFLLVILCNQLGVASVTNKMVLKTPVMQLLSCNFFANYVKLSIFSYIIATEYWWVQDCLEANWTAKHVIQVQGKSVMPSPQSLL